MSQPVIYVPGLGDRFSYGQPFLLFWWRLFGLRVYYLAIGWDKEDFDSGFQKLLDKIDYLSSDHKPVALIGASAGASAVINAYSVRKKLKAVGLIGGKINNPKTVGRIVYQHNPAFEESMIRVSDSLKALGSPERARIMSIHPLTDRVVPPADTVIDGAHEQLLRTRGHIFSIFFTLAFRGHMVAKFIKRQ